MSREIKFRAWHKKNRRMMFRGVFDRNWYTEAKAGKCIDGIHPSDANEVELMQYTGIKDKNGNPIFEGDIVKADLSCLDGEKFKGVVGEVVFSEFEYCLEMEDPNFPVASWVIVDCCEISGNIYENPELLSDNQ